MTQYYVRTDGNDSNSGLINDAGGAWRTITFAGSSSAAGAGDTINVAPGTYSETVTVSKSGTSGNLITMVSTTKWGAKVVAGSTLHSSAFAVTGNYFSIKNFDITGGGAVGLDFKGSFGEGHGNYIHDIPAPGNDGFGGAGIAHSEFPTHTDGIADGNVVARIGGYVPGGINNSVQGLYAAIPNVTYSNNIVYGVLAYAVNTGHYSINCIIVNNTLFGNGNVALDSGGVVITATDAAPTSNGHRVRNNIIYDNQGIGIHEEGTQGSDIIYSNNCVVGNNTNFGNLNGHSNTNNVSTTPTFVNYKRDGSGDYHLTSTSSCTDTGTSLNAPVIDFDLVSRPQNAIYDIGAYEFLITAVSTNKSFFCGVYLG